MKLAPLLRLASVLALAAASLYLSRRFGSSPTLAAPDIRVECRSGAAEIACSVTNRDAERAARVCWSVIGSCANGSEVLGDACATVEPGRITGAFVPVTELGGIMACDSIGEVRAERVQVVE